MLDLDFDFDDSVARGLRTYVRLVSRSMGLHGESSYTYAGEVAHSYVALEGSLPAFPGHDVAPLWDEINGWAAAVEHRGGVVPLVVARFAGNVLPTPEAVAEWVRRLFRQRQVIEVLDQGAPESGDLRQRLAAYTRPHLLRR